MNPKWIGSACALVMLPSSAAALTKTVNFEWVGAAGYSVSAVFNVDTSFGTVAAVEPHEPFRGLHDLHVSVFSPSGTLLDQGVNVDPWIGALYPFLSFSFDTGSMQFTPGSFLDIGWDPGYWLQIHFSPSPQMNLRGRTFELDPDGYEVLVDSGGTYGIVVSGATVRPQVPDSGDTLSGLVATLTILVLFRRGKSPNFAS